MSHPESAGIDPRGPRFTAGITAVLLLVVAVLGFGGAALAAWVLLAALSALFAWAAFAGVRRHPFGLHLQGDSTELQRGSERLVGALAGDQVIELKGIAALHRDRFGQ